MYRRLYESYLSLKHKIQLENKQELSYRKQITCPLCTQYVYKPDYPVTLKSRLRVTQGH